MTTEPLLAAGVPAIPSAAAPASMPAAEADQVPEKFRDPVTGELRVDLLLRSYVELERKMRSMFQVPGDAADPASAPAFFRALGVPESPEAYRVTLPADGPVTVDPEVNRRLHGAGFTPQQVQLVYDLAHEKMIPAIEDLAAAFEAERQLDALVAHFGGEEKWQEVAKTLTAWGRKTLGPTVFEALSGTADGIVAMHKMMLSGEPALLHGAERGGAASEEELKKKMADPRYWRDKDPNLLREVAEGFRRLYPQ